jgi:hypothetical protein
VVKAQGGILEQDTEDEAAAKIHAAVADAVADEKDARWIESHLRPLVGLEAGAGLGGDRRGEAFAAWRLFLEAAADKRPLVLVLDAPAGAAASSTPRRSGSRRCRTSRPRS